MPYTAFYVKFKNYINVYVSIRHNIYIVYAALYVYGIFVILLYGNVRHTAIFLIICTAFYVIRHFINLIYGFLRHTAIFLIYSTAFYGIRHFMVLPCGYIRIQPLLVFFYAELYV